MKVSDFTDDDYRILDVRVGNESLFSVYDAVADKIGNYLLGAIQDFGEFIHKPQAEIYTIPHRDFKKLRDKILASSYHELSELTIDVPAGFEGNIYQYGHYLRTSLTTNRSAIEEVLGYTRPHLAKSLNETNTGTTRPIIKYLLDYKETRASHKETIETYFNRSHELTRRKFGDVFNTKQEMVDFIEAFKSTEVDVKELAKVQTSVRELSLYLNKVVERSTDIDRKTLATLGQAVYQIAKGVEEYSVLNYRAGELFNTVKKLT